MRAVEAFFGKQKAEGWPMDLQDRRKDLHQDSHLWEALFRVANASDEPMLADLIAFRCIGGKLVRGKDKAGKTVIQLTGYIDPFAPEDYRVFNSDEDFEQHRDGILGWWGEPKQGEARLSTHGTWKRLRGELIRYLDAQERH